MLSSFILAISLLVNVPTHSSVIQVDSSDELLQQLDIAAKKADKARQEYWQKQYELYEKEHPLEADTRPVTYYGVLFLDSFYSTSESFKSLDDCKHIGFMDILYNRAEANMSSIFNRAYSYYCIDAKTNHATLIITMVCPCMGKSLNIGQGCLIDFRACNLNNYT